MAKVYTVKRRREAADAWLERMNPLRGLSIRQAESIYDSARDGSYALLHLVYSEIEKTDPVLLTCVERRAAALAGLGWKAETAPGSDAGLAKEQTAAIGELVAGIENFEEALEHLDVGFFRGFAHAEPVFGADGMVRKLLLPESWNFCLEPRTGSWWWNPEARTAAPGSSGMEEIPPGRLVTVLRPRAIDHPATNIYLRSALSEREWGRFVERYGLPPVILTAPPNTNSEQDAQLATAAGDAYDGRCGVVPNGTAINYATEARGTDPFSAFIAHQEKLTVLLATGGTLTSLAEAGSGTLAGNAQMDVWRQIVARDAVIIGAALDRVLVQPFLRTKFPGWPKAASFALGADRDLTAEEVFEMAAKARAAGYIISKEDLQRRTGFSLEREENSPGMGAPGTGWLANAEMPSAKEPHRGLANPLQNARAPQGGTSVPPDAPNASRGLLRAFAADTGPAAERLAALLARADAGEDIADEARKLADELPSLMGGEQEMAAVLGEELARAMAGELQKGGAE